MLAKLYNDENDRNSKARSKIIYTCMIINVSNRLFVSFSSAHILQSQDDQKIYRNSHRGSHVSRNQNHKSIGPIDNMLDDAIVISREQEKARPSSADLKNGAANLTKIGERSSLILVLIVVPLALGALAIGFIVGNYYCKMC